MPIGSSALQSLLFFGYLIAALLIIAMTWQAARIALWPARRVFSLIANDTASRIIGFAVAALLCSDATHHLTTFLRSSVMLLSSLAGNAAQTTLAENHSIDANYQGVNHQDTEYHLTEDRLGSAQYQWNHDASMLEIGEIAILIGIAIIIGRLLSLRILWHRSEGHGNLLHWLRSLNPGTRRMITTGCIMLSGAYLAIAAIVAVPWLRIDPAETAQAAKTAEENIIRSLPAESAFTLPSKIEISTPELDRAIKALESAEGLTADLSRALQATKSIRAELTQYERQWNVERDALPTTINSLKDQALTRLRQFQTEKPSAHDLGRYGTALTVWLSRSVSDLNWTFRRTFDQASSAAQQMDKEALFLMSILQTKGDSASLSPNQLLFYSGDMRPLRGLDPSELSPPEPTRSLPGWPFSVFANWLIMHDSIDLVVVIGMFGFGILGSMLPALVPGIQGTSLQPLILPQHILAKGFFAAIGVFLAVQGGLSILAGSVTNANPYGLFLSCMLAAVFSDRFWDWARQRWTSPAEGGKPRDPSVPENPAKPTAAPDSASGKNPELIVESSDAPASTPSMNPPGHPDESSVTPDSTPTLSESSRNLAIESSSASDSAPSENLPLPAENRESSTTSQRRP